MIMTKTPFRISFAGGGSDLADFYEQYGGCVLSTSINRYCYISIHPYFDENKTLLKYSENELVSDLSEIRHRIFNCVLNERKLHGVEIVSTADVPGGTGLGSSSTFTVGLINTLNCYQGKYMSKGEIAERACRVEIEKLGSPIGKQDQYAPEFHPFPPGRHGIRGPAHDEAGNIPPSPAEPDDVLYRRCPVGQRHFVGAEEKHELHG